MSDVQEEPPGTEDTDAEMSGLPDPMGLDALLATGELPASWRVRLSTEALREALTMSASEPAYTGLPLRVYIDGKGCDGFYYGVSFDPAAADDVVFAHDGLNVVVDRQSLRFLLGAVVNWIDDERGRGFLVENPLHRRYRGKFYKRKAWQETLIGPKTPSPH